MSVLTLTDRFNFALFTECVVSSLFLNIKLSYCIVQEASGQGLFEQVFKVYK